MMKTISSSKTAITTPAVVSQVDLVLKKALLFPSFYEARGMEKSRAVKSLKLPAWNTENS